MTQVFYRQRLAEGGLIEKREYVIVPSTKEEATEELLRQVEEYRKIHVMLGYPIGYSGSIRYELEPARLIVKFYE